MSLRLRGSIYHYDFTYKKKRYQGSTDQSVREDAELVVAEVKKRLRQESWGIAPADRNRTPTFTKWAEVYFRDQIKQGKRADFVEGCLNTLLIFWGAKPTRPRKQPAVVVDRPGSTPYHNLRLLDPITRPELILDFEEWMTARKLSGARKNHLRSTLSMMFRLAMSPQWRRRTNIVANPFAGIRRDKVRARARVLSIDEIRDIMGAAPFHLRVAMIVAVYAPKFRVGNILALNFADHVARDFSKITVREHKADATAPPLVAPVVPGSDLHRLLIALKRLNKSGYLVEYEGAPIDSIKTAVRAAVESAGLVYGARKKHGVTFHTIRHSIATLLATMSNVSEKLRSEIMGQTMQTTQKYTHLGAAHQVAGHAELYAAIPLGALIGMQGNLQGEPQRDSANLAEIQRIPKRVVRSAKRRKSR